VYQMVKILHINTYEIFSHKNNLIAKKKNPIVISYGVFGTGCYVSSAPNNSGDWWSFLTADFCASMYSPNSGSCSIMPDLASNCSTNPAIPLIKPGDWNVTPSDAVITASKRRTTSFSVIGGVSIHSIIPRNGLLFD